jgi:hypothetical protein
MFLVMSLFLSACSTEPSTQEPSQSISQEVSKPLPYNVNDLVLLKPDNGIGVIKEVNLPSNCGCPVSSSTNTDTTYVVIDQSHKEIITDGFLIAGKYIPEIPEQTSQLPVQTQPIKIAKQSKQSLSKQTICQGHNPIPADTIYATIGEILSISFIDNSMEDGDQATVFIGDDNVMSCTQILNVARTYPIKFTKSIHVTWCACNQGTGLNTGEIQIGNTKFPVLLKTGESHTITILPYEIQRRHS